MSPPLIPDTPGIKTLFINGSSHFGVVFDTPLDVVEFAVLIIAARSIPHNLASPEILSPTCEPSSET